MKMKFQISKMSQLELQVLMNKILLQLSNQHYIIENKTDNTISFKDNNWEIRPKGTGFRKVDKGLFEITQLNQGEVLIKYTYYISFIPEVIITSVIVIIGFFQSYLILLIALPFLFQLAVRATTLKQASQEMLTKITG